MWKEYKPSILRQGATRFWQKEIYPEIYANFTEYPPDTRKVTTYGLDIQLDMGEQVINIERFTYFKKDLKQAEKDAKEIIDKLK